MAVLQIKTTVRYHLTPVRIAIIKKRPQITNVGEDVEKGEHFWWECKLVQPLWKIVWRFLEKLKIALPYDPEIPFLGIHPKKTKQLI